MHGRAGKDSAPPRTGAAGIPSLRPTLTGTRHMVSSNHHLASQAAFQVLEASGNAVDAAVAGGLVLGVVQSDIVSIAGVAPIMLHLAEERRTLTIDGLGTWPRAASVELFRDRFGGRIPRGVLRTVVPAAPCAWITALARFGTLSFAEVAGSAIRFAREGFPMYPLLADSLATFRDRLAEWPSTAAIYLPNGAPPRAGDRFVQADLAATLQYMADEERAARARAGDRAAGLAAARDAFYRGDIARRIVAAQEDHGGLLTRDDLADFACRIEPAVAVDAFGLEVLACGPWCQGPSLLQMLRLLDGLDLAAMGHNSADYIHAVVEAMKLAFADRERHFGDPRFVEVPLERLLSRAYAEVLRGRIDMRRATVDMPAPGEPERCTDTSYICVVDRDGNAVSATPSDSAFDAPVVPGTGLVPSTRGCQSWGVPGHPSAVAPGKRPRLTPNPAMAFAGDGRVMPFGSPGGDVQVQAMLQVLLNLQVFGMTPQAAVEAPRFASYSFPDSFEPHASWPGRLNLEARIDADVAGELASRGHEVQWWPSWSWQAGAVCLVSADAARRDYAGAADPRRQSYAVGW
jgi:gamma-glutamyltranspeptidase/glutathione hydrolase